MRGGFNTGTVRMNLGLGIDTGGTYTDAAIIDLDNGTVLCKSKALTTRNDLSNGISASIACLDKKLFKKIKLVSVSTTLATNSIVEGKGCRVALIAAGFEIDGSLPVESAIRIRGGHDHSGEPAEDLDLEAAQKFVLTVRDNVDGFAVSTYFSIRNPEHEIALRQMISSLTDLPVVCGHDLSSNLGFNERTVTAVLNAKLIPLITDLVGSVKGVLKGLQIDSPLMIVKGDGSLMGESVAKNRPVETILSGPAASLTGAGFLTGEKEAVVIDVGGTTTDIGILRGGKPRLDREGALVGGWRTMVRAAGVSTSGIGGDSRIVIHLGKIHLTPLRVVPLCIANTIFPKLAGKIKKAGHREWNPLSSVDLDSTDQPTEFFVFSREVHGYELNHREREFIELIREEPRSIREIRDVNRDLYFSLNVGRLEEIGIVQRIGLTPTDVLHAEGSYVSYDPTPSKMAVDIQAKALGLTTKEFCAAVKNAVTDKITLELLKKLIFEETGKSTYCSVTGDFLEKFISQERGADYSCRLRLHKKLIGIGAPVGTYLPSVAEKLHTELILPRHAEVGNAIGAITGSIVETVEILIKTMPGAYPAKPACILHSPVEKREFNKLGEAVEYAKKVGAKIVTDRAVLSGADSIEVVTEEDRIGANLGNKCLDDLALEVKVRVRAIGKPKQFLEEKRLARECLNN